MPLRNDIEAKYLTAMKAKDAQTVSVLRMLRSAVKNAQIEKMKELTDEEALEIVSKEAKKLKDASVEFEKGGRQDLVSQTQAELSILAQFMPAQLSEAEVLAVVKEKAAELGLSGPSAMGQLTGATMKAVKGRADGTLVSRLVKEHLQ